MATATGTETRPPDHLSRRGPPPGPPAGLSTSTPLNSGTPAWARARSNGDRSYHKIISDASLSTANIILKINLESISPDRRLINISDSQLGDFIFNELKFPIEDVLRLGFSTGRNNTKEILVKFSADLTTITIDHLNPPHHRYKD